MPGTYGPVIKPVSVSTKPTAGGSTTGAPESGSKGVGLGVKLAFKKGGSASSRADGCARKGKTKGRFV